MEAATRYADDLDANKDAVLCGLRVEQERVPTMVTTLRRRLGTARPKGPPDTQKNARPTCRPQGQTGRPVSCSGSWSLLSPSVKPVSQPPSRQPPLPPTLPGSTWINKPAEKRSRHSVIAQINCPEALTGSESEKAASC